MNMKADLATQSNYLSIKSVHLDLEWKIDWDARLISGSVEHTLVALHDDIQEIVFDTSYLIINSVTLSDETSKSLDYVLDEKRHPVLGNALHINLPGSHKVKKDQQVKVKIAYSTTDKCTALGWLEAHQTASGKYPFLYSQCQAIHMRSLAPCMDTPAVKATCRSPNFTCYKSRQRIDELRS